ncbi:uncharacterized protein LOC122036438 [Zingiber officinale]|uniref:uncharacterized protein LOC122036438 n=1 Tax=Zingiber officinale TaxID=94328 RepID=UPI001C4AD25E|nr:uncharacterized protein LOC122036438 [Zingiber officinale]
MGSVGVLTAAADQKLTVAETEEEEVEQGREIHAVLDFDMLCATVALQTQGFSAGRTRWKESAAEEAEEEGLKFGGVQRMWEGDVMDCFDDRRIAIEAACFPCYRFGKNMQRANLGSFFLQAAVHCIFILAALVNFIAFGITNQYIYVFMGIASSISAGLYLSYFRIKIKRQFNIRGSDSLDDCVNHLICPCCTLSQESRTLEMNNVQNGVWHGRGDTICLVSSGEGSNAFPGISKPPLHCSMERVSAGSQHSWNTDTNQSEQLVPPDQFGQNG